MAITFVYTEMQERSVEGRNNSPEQETEECEFIGEKDVLSYARQVALGMVRTASIVIAQAIIKVAKAIG